MAAAGGVALPSREYQAFGPAYEWIPHSAYGGQRGTVEIPDRVAVLEGRGIPAVQSPEPAFPTGPFGNMVRHLAFPIFELVCEGGLSLLLGENQGHKQLATTGVIDGVPAWVRRWLPNTAPLDRVAPVEAKTNWSTNRDGRAETDIIPTGPIRRDARKWTYTFRMGFDQRIQTDYIRRPAIQKSVVPRRIASGQPGPQGEMLLPFFPRLTQLQNDLGSFGSQTEVVTPTPPPADLVAAF